jgi:hypothetical protein
MTSQKSHVILQYYVAFFTLFFQENYSLILLQIFKTTEKHYIRAHKKHAWFSAAAIS